jgi:hypothetical protein
MRTLIPEITEATFRNFTWGLAMLWGINDRRHFMKHMAATASFAAASDQFLGSLHAQTKELKKQNKALIILRMGGGSTTIDLWDMKPGHANGGEHRPKTTAASGIQISEHLPKLAAQFKNLSIVRSLSTTEGDHMRGTVLTTTGFSPNPLVQYPPVGAVLANQFEESNGDLPPFITVQTGTRDGGFLGMRYAPFTVQNPGTPPQEIRPPEGVDTSRMERRAGLFTRLETSFKVGTEKDSTKSHKEIYDKALSLVVSKNKEVFSLDKEPASMRTEYGNNQFGNGCLLARKLVEAGSVCVEVGMGGWDMHNGIFNALSSRALPQLDMGFAALTRDLKDRGMLNNVAILWVTEFGRTPRINQNGGRDHYPRAWSVVLGGGGVKGGIAYGSTDAGGESVKDNKVTINDVYSTIYQGLGLAADKQIRDNLGRPMLLAGTNSKAIKELL